MMSSDRLAGYGIGLGFPLALEEVRGYGWKSPP